MPIGRSAAITFQVAFEDVNSRFSQASKMSACAIKTLAAKLLILALKQIKGLRGKSKTWEGGMMRQPDPQSERGGPPQATPSFAKPICKKQPRIYSVSPETQVAIYTLLPIVLLVGVLAWIGGAR
jgi:hypothetical protein